MKKSKVQMLIAFMFSVIITSSISCKKDPPHENPTEQDAEITEVIGEISENTTWKTTNKILLKGFVYVTNGVTLTIEPGTVIKGDKDSKATLIVEPGGKLIAEGTKEKPIVFTSNQPAGSRRYGDWGGLIICGKAAVNAPGTMTIEGGPRTKYGNGAGFAIDNNDNSGILKYVRVEFSGVEYATDNEINGITFGGVGSGTKIDYVQVSYCGDDSFEWFGGSVNGKHLIAYRGWDDEFDTDNGYHGNLQFLVGLRDPNVADKSKSNGFESDNDASGSTNSPFTQPIFSNVSMFGPYPNLNNIQSPTGGSETGQFQAAMHLRRNTKLNVFNSVFAGWPIGLFIENDKGSNTQGNATNGDLQITNCVLAGMQENFKTEFDNTYFNRENSENFILTNCNDMKVNNPFQLGNPVFTLKTDSPLNDKANFSDSRIQNAFFEKVDYIGAFGTDDWTSGWTNFDPQNEVYWQ